MNTYIIRITTIDNLFADYMIEAKNIMQAKFKAKNIFFKTYPDADANIKLSLEEPSPKVITEIMDIIRKNK